MPLKGGEPVWGEPATAAGPLEGLVARLIQTRQLPLDPALKRNGPLYKRFAYARGALHFPVDLFIVDADGGNRGICSPSEPATPNARACW